ncbi:unnamed protein product [Brachionus calyciflorus]|uniref:Uncharacterized protein n=1 Tax=Brachionus calyciflorus TaxID=104777 RepID=A0A814AXE0_9BILA|nr:unnamed protein product [Brachionus calyciflorus]
MGLDRITQYFKLNSDIREALNMDSVRNKIDRRIEDLFHYGKTFLKIDIMMFMGFYIVYNRIFDDNQCNELEENESNIISYQKYLEKVNEFNWYE